MQKASYYAVHFVCHMGNMTVNNHIFVPSEIINLLVQEHA